MNFDFKNVQWRVYDALNVLHALGMITKDRNWIQFINGSNATLGLLGSIEASSNA